MDYVIHLGDYIYEYKNGDYGWYVLSKDMPWEWLLPRRVPRLPVASQTSKTDSDMVI